MTYEVALAEINRLLPNYQRVGITAFNASLDSIEALCAATGHPERSFASVHIAGTNGKGSTAHILASMLQEAGMKTGLYTSPHLLDFRERVKVNGVMVPKDYVTKFMEDYRDLLAEHGASFFEMTALLSFCYFRDEKIDLAVLETGLGGRLDATNVVTPEVSIITNISLDHTHILGDTISKIAREKAGIIKTGVPVVIGKRETESASVFEEVADGQNAPITWVESAPLPFPTDLQGNYQAQNVQTALATCELLRAGGWELTPELIERGANKVISNTKLVGRWQVLTESPKTVLDVAHNPEGLSLVLEQVRTTPHQQLHVVLGVVADKHLDAIMPLFPSDAQFYYCEPDIPRALPVNELTERASALGFSGLPYPSPNEALTAAQTTASPQDFILVCGSAFVVAEILA